MADERSDWREGNDPWDRATTWEDRPPHAPWTEEPGNLTDFRLRGGQPPASWEAGREAPPASRGMGYASPQGYQSPLSGAAAGREAVREHERGPWRGSVAGERGREGMGMHPLARGARGEPWQATGLETGLKGLAVLLGVVGILLLGFWLVASIDLAFGWPSGLFVAGILLVGGALVAWLGARAREGGGMARRRGGGWRPQ